MTSFPLLTQKQFDLFQLNDLSCIDKAQNGPLTIQGSINDVVFNYLKLNIIKRLEKEGINSDVIDSFEDEFYKHDIKLQLHHLKEVVNLFNSKEPIQYVINQLTICLS